MILKLSKDKKLTFYRKNPIYIGEKDFNTIEVLISPTIDGNETNELNFILHLVNKDGEYLHIDLDKEIKEDIIVGSTQITTNITSIAQKFSVYIEMIRGNDEIIGKTNVLEIEVNPLPDEQGEITPEEIERRSTIISQDNPPESSHKKYKLNALWINYTDKTQFVLTSIDESQAPEKYVYTWERNNNHVIVSTETAPEYTPNNVDYKYSNGDIWVQTDLDSDKIISISVCTGYTKESIDDETWRYNYTWAILNSGVTNYNELNNKPQINNITLQGNKTLDDLSLQSKLTAGNNITINNGVISASGGVTSYEDLTDKPTVQVNGSRIVPLSGKLTFTSGFFLANYLPGELIRVDLRNVSRSALESGQNYLVGMQVPSDNHFTAQYDFNNLRNPQAAGDMDYKDAGFFKCIGKCLLNTPQIFSSSIGDNSRVMIIHFNTIPINERYYYLLRVIYFQDSSTNKIRQFAQWIYYESEQDTIVHAVTDWCEIGGGSQIVSGVVNANGTIAFTDSDGNTFTTTGASVIGADGFSPVATVTQTASGATVSITDSTGTTTANISNGQDGNDYVLTAQDKSDIADIVLSELPTTQGVLYGNTSN